jgi:FHS family L-fucose permease-like MFS transporter
MRTLPIFLAFFLMGLADAMGPNSDARERTRTQMSNVMSTLLPFVVFIAFAVFSVPGGIAGSADWQEESCCCWVWASTPWHW